MAYAPALGIRIAGYGQEGDVTERKEINNLLAKIYARLANDLVDCVQRDDQANSKIFLLHHNQVNAYYSALGNSASEDELDRLAKDVLHGFADVLDQGERPRLKEWFQTTENATARESLLRFANGMVSVFRSFEHAPLRPYDPRSLTGTDSGLQVLGW